MDLKAARARIWDGHCVEALHFGARMPTLAIPRDVLESLMATWLVHALRHQLAVFLSTLEGRDADPAQGCTLWLGAGLCSWNYDDDGAPQGELVIDPEEPPAVPIAFAQALAHKDALLRMGIEHGVNLAPLFEGGPGYFVARRPAAGAVELWAGHLTKRRVELQKKSLQQGLTAAGLSLLEVNGGHIFGCRLAALEPPNRVLDLDVEGRMRVLHADLQGFLDTPAGKKLQARSMDMPRAFIVER